MYHTTLTAVVAPSVATGLVLPGTRLRRISVHPRGNDGVFYSFSSGEVENGQGETAYKDSPGDTGPIELASGTLYLAAVTQAGTRVYVQVWYE